MPVPGFIAGFLLAATLVGCASAGSAPATTRLEDTEWTLVDIGGAPLPEGLARLPSLKLVAAEGKVVGFSGCNRLFGAYSVDGPRLRLSPLGTTKMACIGPAMEVERRFLDALGRATSYDISDGTLRLRAEDRVLARLHAASAP